MTADERMVQGTALESYLDHAAARFLHRLLHRNRYFFCLPLTHTDPTIAIADHRQRGEGEDATALDHLGDAVDADHLFAQAVSAVILLLPGLLPSHWLCLIRSLARISSRFRGQRRRAPSLGRDICIPSGRTRPLRCRAPSLSPRCACRRGLRRACCRRSSSPA